MKEQLYTAKDFERYHNGTMSDKERHALEKAALEDAFLSDALDGYAFTSTPKEDIDDLKERLAKRTKQRAPVVSMRTESYKWLSVAAILVVVSGAGLFFYLNQSQKENVLVADNKTSSYKKNDTVSVANGLAQSSAPAISGKIAANGNTYSIPDSGETIRQNIGSVSTATLQTGNTYFYSTADSTKNSLAVTTVPEAVIEIISRGYEKKDLELGPPFYLAQGVRDIFVFDPYTEMTRHFTARANGAINRLTL